MNIYRYFIHLSLCLANNDMSWADTWNDILNGGSSRWKIDDLAHKQAALEQITRHSDKPDSPLSILCPLAGDDPFVPHAWKQGHSVAAIDLVPAAIEAMKAHFDGSDWKKQESSNVNRWSQDRVTLCQADMLQPIEDMQPFDAVYDKDAFGALEKHMRQPYCQRIAEYTRPGGILYLEVKNKPDTTSGPPFHVTKEDLEENFTEFEFVKELGEVYENKSWAGMKQMGHIMKRK